MATPLAQPPKTNIPTSTNDEVSRNCSNSLLKTHTAISWSTLLHRSTALPTTSPSPTERSSQFHHPNMNHTWNAPHGDNNRIVRYQKADIMSDGLKSSSDIRNQASCLMDSTVWHHSRDGFLEMRH
ncbi:hypothetical protein KC19_2G254100 [Ceratodon purpureus]|uniref:Uncharacterized protein n=1 Tax=Ceratodon purpureus TaxID=3225 RepID=A0A8T0J0C8_CERPU|nr:hypothetical protein KC19_2G254100 [Ceratodon purpureus]